jgi:hypothetical protein
VVVALRRIQPGQPQQNGRHEVWLISFMQYDLGFFDHESNRFECAESPFAAKVLPMSSV